MRKNSLILLFLTVILAVSAYLPFTVKTVAAASSSYIAIIDQPCELTNGREAANNNRSHAAGNGSEGRAQDIGAFGVKPTNGTHDHTCSNDTAIASVSGNIQIESGELIIVGTGEYEGTTVGYGHLESFVKNSGTVSVGDIVGTIGVFSNYRHIHFWVRSSSATSIYTYDQWAFGIHESINGNTGSIHGDYNGDGIDDIFIVSGDASYTRRKLQLGRADGSGFDTGCYGQADGVCGTDSEGYMRDTNTRYLVGDYNGDGRDDIFIVSGDAGYTRRRLHLGRSDGSGFDTGCYGQADGVCGTDSEGYMRNANTRYLVGDYNGDGRDDIFIVSGDASYTRRKLQLGRADGSGFDTGCYGQADGVCGTDSEGYMRDTNTRYLVGDYNGDGRDDIFIVSGDASYTRRRLHLGRSDGSGFDTGCYGQADGVCGTDSEGYMRNANTRYLVGDYNGDGRDDIFIVSGDASYTRRKLQLGRADGSGFDTGCYGQADGVCGTDSEGYMRNANTRYLVGDYNGDGRDDIFVVSGDASYTRRKLHLGRADGSGFDTGCYGQADGVCGTDSEGYMRNANTRYLVGDYNGDGRDDIFVVSGDASYTRRKLHLGRADGSGFDTGCYGQADGVCGTDSEGYMRDTNTRYL